MTHGSWPSRLEATGRELTEAGERLRVEAFVRLRALEELPGPVRAIAEIHRLIDTVTTPSQGVWARSAALLARQALEAAVRVKLDAYSTGLDSAPFRAQLLCLHGVIGDSDVAREANDLWSALYFGLISAALSEAGRKAFQLHSQGQRFFDESQRQSFDRGLAEGRATEKATDVLDVLDARGLEVTEAQRKRVLGCSDLEITDGKLLGCEPRMRWATRCTGPRHRRLSSPAHDILAKLQEAGRRELGDFRRSR